MGRADAVGSEMEEFLVKRRLVVLAWGVSGCRGAQTKVSWSCGDQETETLVCWVAHRDTEGNLGDGRNGG